MYRKVTLQIIRTFILVTILLAIGSSSSTAQYATSGTGLYKNLIFWLNWDLNGNGLGDDIISNNTTRTFNIGNGIVLTGTISNYSGSPQIRSYVTGTWMGDKLDDLYGGVNPIGISNLGSVVTYTITFNATKNGVAFTLPGLIVAEAEDLLGTDQFDQFTTSGNDWRLVDKNMPNYVEATYSNNNKTIRLNRPSSTGNSNAGTGLYYTNVNSVDIVTGAGQSMAYGVMFPAEYSDAPASYGTPMHFSLVPTVSGGTNPGTPVNVVGLSGMALGTINFSNPSVLLGSSIVISPAASPSVNANGINGEDAFPTGVKLYSGATSQNLTVPVKNTSGTSVTLYGWIDVDNDGIFETTEIATISVPNGASSAVLNWPSLPNLITGSSYYVRLRITSEAITDNANTAVDERSTAQALDGEVEDYLSTQSTLPLQWGKFEAWREGKLVQLRWNTNQEVQLKKFEIERSINGNEWVIILENVPAVNSYMGHTYQQTDPNPIYSKLYYRIKQIDISGQSSYSNIAAIDAANKPVAMGIYPNPAATEFYLNNNDSAIRTVEVYTASGNIVQRWSTPMNRYSLNGIAEGMYTIRVVCENGNIRTFRLNKSNLR